MALSPKQDAEVQPQGPGLSFALESRCAKILRLHSYHSAGFSPPKKGQKQSGLCMERQKNKSAEPIATVPKKDIFLVLQFFRFAK